MEQYSSYFSAGMKVGVGIPLPNSEIFLDWALIDEVDEDLVTLQLSRDHLPVGISLHEGQVVDLRGGKDDAAYGCRAIIVIEGRESRVLLRLIGEIVTDELREFYRIDAFLPIKYYISREQNPDLLKEEWQSRRIQRLNAEQLRKQQRWDSTFLAKSSDLPPERLQEAPPDEPDDQDPSWDTIIPLAASISGGGIRIVSHQRFEEGQYVPLEIMVPMPRRIVEVVGRVVFVKPKAGAGNRESYNVALKFIFIDERDRDAIVNHIVNVQLIRIRQLRKNFSTRDGLGDRSDNGAIAPFDWKRMAKKLVCTVVGMLIMAMLFFYYLGYATSHPKNEIEQTFESGIRRFMEMRGK
jgi:hypothetical protein